jgi:GDPmannose 4,6-dehydratase
MKTALITGVTGQDGSYLAELLLEKGYRVVGVVRRSSTENFERIAHIQNRLELVQADLLDQYSLIEAVRSAAPDEVYNLAAQSFVPTSWNQPVLTGEFTALGVTRLLEAIRLVNPKIRFYQASSSEMFGMVRQTPQDENTPFHPRSPYGVAKVYGHYITVNYRESYDLFTVSGILFNHECVTAETPVFVRCNGLIDLSPIEDIVPHRTEAASASRYTTVPGPQRRLDVWDAGGWTAIACMTATWNGCKHRANREVFRIAARGAVYQATGDHIVFTEENGAVVEKPAAQVRVGDTLAMLSLPSPTNRIRMTEEEAWLLGILSAEGYICANGQQVQVTNQDTEILDQVAERWHQVCGGTTSRRVHPSGFQNGKAVTQLRLKGAGTYARYLRESLYTRSGHKRIPQRVLNASCEARLAFLHGFHAGDGLKSTPCTYVFQGFKTSSAVLAAGLYWMAATTLGQRAIVCTEERNGRLDYQINLNSPNTPGRKGQHLMRPLAEVVTALPVTYGGWLFDLATTTGTFHAGIGQGWMHNSPRRGREFVTRKVSDGVAQIKLGLAKELRLGNLEARRDWGFAGDYVEAMYRMLQQEAPDDYVIATGETHSVRELVETAFAQAGLDWDTYVVQDPAFYRPAEVDLLVGNAAKAKAKLGWEPKVTFRALIESMVEADIARWERFLRYERGAARKAKR